MISAEYCRTMARYGAWQNAWHVDAMATLDPAELTADRRAFFGSILGTANHLLWGDQIWMSRFDGGPAPEGSISSSAAQYGAYSDWREARLETDARIRAWADDLSDGALVGDLSWFSGALGRDVFKPLSLCITHFFNHQTHHRGQIHTMLTAAGASTEDTDLFIMPEDT